MSEKPPAAKQTRSGRPKREFAGEVDERILLAARHVFLERGFEAASIDEIADAARAGKPTIYARHASKEALFTAVVLRLMSGAKPLGDFEPPGATTQERLTNLAGAILERALVPESVDLFRSVIAEARRFPDLAAGVGRAVRERGVESVLKLFGEIAGADDALDRLAFTSDRLPITARLFLDLVVLPYILRALYGESAESMRAEFAEILPMRVAFFLTACRRPENPGEALMG
jgi:AcrR family transcriptional regulator